MTVLKPDTSEIMRFLDLVAAPGQIVELRLLELQRASHGFPCMLSGYFSD
jgi:hypothetical protein